ncbi:hypothetical protein [Bacteroides finegoldii]|jgi:hypothetical protein|uniref:Uncharacterized protein n=1 Tax=Bacteroides finegoldii TaxID=338188 RepID=A0A7J4YHQ0_9BACE|nr:hypothetical protein [Bacteroides finegoldii]BDW74306.1 hypothetical protein BFINE_01010 [Bacteroides finegoldii DSM 17565]KAA5211063.1 hypothetical protein F2Z28_21630 [Bacteroides finegoldii]KAA5215607.1 hypothetical protein F2Z16_21650 [Bacteroides finegoldii]KAA5220623.1 hypothetical protein F2Z20_22560 [Bacteroides finegoldii]KAA5224538.1 hypothetical protein F2Z22_22830 [Bacteroides finegoldii]
MNLETKITIYKFTPQVFTLTPLYGIYEVDEKVDLISGRKKSTFLGYISLNIYILHKSNSR